MNVKFWGVRGSIPTPLTPAQLESKIAAVVQRMTPEDAQSTQSRQAFLANLPDSLINTIGGNTTCVEITLKDGTRIIIDAGTGIRELGLNLLKRKDENRDFHLLFTHFHWDHIQGLPFFDPAYIPGNRFFFYSPSKDNEKFLEEQMRFPFYPVTMEAMGSSKKYIRIPEGEFTIGSATIAWRRMKHPGSSISYRITEGDKTFIFSTDTELQPRDFEKSEENRKFYENVDVLVMDSQYTLDEAIEKYDWGHTSYSLAVDFAAAWQIPRLGLFHHEPKYDDNKIYSILNSAKWYLSHQENSDIDIFLATEGLELSL